MKQKELTHTDAEGRAHMVNVGDKPFMQRMARAEGKIHLEPATIQLIRENGIRKGDVLTVAEIAGIMAAKRTPDLIPLCHPLPISQVEVKASLIPEGVYVQSMVKCTAQTGVEMEALTAVQIALLNIYDMCKAVDKNMVIGPVRLVEKTKEAAHNQNTTPA
ncbi:MAG TPA: cyclic pyranopterin monophosphate synthase MoaC [Bacteroidales bacterium]|nr:cyclic pyranopterin monophosphate synthase MoaC [Lentimicrobiaceae bacterium]HOH99988.1 cyclic pyranopterin monophosphate synthase MoaC [Bacteroidales bacterium]